MNNPFDRLYESCNLCPRLCGVNRLKGETGVCGETASLRVASACVHFGEEPPVTGKGGSGTVFFTGCTLGCRFCQNSQISHAGMGGNLTEEELASIFLRLEADGAENINLVTATHFTPGVLYAIDIARGRGLSIPIVWNSSGYEEVDTLRLISANVDIWLPDAKTFDERVAKELFCAADYPEKNRAALLFMAEHTTVEWHGDTLKKGMIVRHLVLPGETGSTSRILKWYKSALYGKALLSLMCQYIPVHGDSDVRDPGLRVDLGKYLTKDEYGDCLFLLDELGIHDGFIQEQCGDSDWKPDFSRRNPFPGNFAKPVWHFKD